MAPSRDATLHQRILGEIENKIVTREWPPGHRIPFEVELAEQYGCSRMTVNKVLGQLAKAGLIERRKRSGSFVRHPRSQAAVLEIHDIRSEVEQLKLPYAFTLVKRVQRQASSVDMQRLDLSVAGPVLELVCVHMAGTRPFCVEERLINLTTVPDASDADFAETSPSPWLLREIPWSTAEHRIQAMPASAAIGALLRLAVGAACLVIERRTWLGAGPVTQVRLTYPGDRHALLARFTPAA